MISATATTQESASKSDRKSQPTALIAASLAKFAAMPVPRAESPTAAAIARSPSGGGRGEGEGGRASQTIAKVAGISTATTTATLGQSASAPRCGTSSYQARSPA